MAEHNGDNGDDRADRSTAAAAPAEKNGRSWQTKLIFAVVVLALAALAYLFAVTIVPRWWAQRVGDQVDGTISKGVAWGLFYGVVFTFVPLLVARQAVRKVGWTMRIAFLVAAAVLALPNLLTLGVVIGSGSAAHAAERVLDVEAPAFRAWTLIGAIASALLAGGAFTLMAAGRRNRHKLKELEAERKARLEQDKQ
jgi:ATP/ADP translocase